MCDLREKEVDIFLDNPGVRSLIITHRLNLMFYIGTLICLGSFFSSLWGSANLGSGRRVEARSDTLIYGIEYRVHGCTTDCGCDISI